MWYTYHIVKELLKRKSYIIAIAFFCSTTIFVLFPTIFQGKVPLPTDLAHDYLLDEPKEGENPLIRDSVVQLYPNAHVMFTAYKEGDSVVVNPYIFAGDSQGLNMAASGQSTLWSPLNVFIPLFNSSLAFFSFIIVVYCLLSGVGMYAFLRSMKLDVGVAIFGGVVFQLSAPLLGWMAWGTISGAIAMLPLMLAAISYYRQTHNPIWLVVFTIAQYISLTAGHLQFYLYGMGVVFLYIFFLPLIHPVLADKIKNSLRNWMLVGITALVNMVAVLFVITPFVQAISLSHRTGLSDTSYLQLQNLLQFIYPNAWGSYQDYAGPLNYLESAGYIGILPLVLIGIGVVLAIRRVKDINWSPYIFWLAVAVTGLGYMMVPTTWPIEFINSFPPFRAIFIVDFALIILAALVLQHLITTRLWKPWYTAGIIAIAFMNQWMVFGGFTPQQDPEPLLNPPAYVTYLREQDIEQPLVYSEISPLNLYSLYGIRSIFGYDSMYFESYYQNIKLHAKKMKSHRNILNAKITDRNFLRELGVNYIITKRELQQIEPVFQDDDIRIYAL